MIACNGICRHCRHSWWSGYTVEQARLICKAQARAGDTIRRRYRAGKTAACNYYERDPGADG